MRNIRIAVATLLVALTASGCKVGPNFQSPETQAPAGWSTTGEGWKQAVGAADVRWWEQFGDPQLNSLIERMAKENLDIRIASKRLDEALAFRRQEKAGYLPSVDASAGYQRRRTSETVGSSYLEGNRAKPKYNPIDDYQTGFDATWELDVFGRVRRAVEAADAEIKASAEDQRALLVTLLGETARTYIELRGLQTRLAVVEQNRASQSQTLDLTRRRLEAGIATELDLNRSAAQVASTEAQLPPLRAAVERSLHRLGVLLGKEPGALKAELSATKPIPAIPSEVAVSLPAELIRRRPDVRAAEQNLAAETARIGVAQADLYPRFLISGNLGLQTSSLQHISTGGSRTWGIGPSVSIPLLDRGAIKARVRAQTARTDAALLNYQQTVLTSLEEAENALTNFSQEQARRRSLEQAVAANRKAAALSRELFDKGLIDFLSVLEAQRSLLESEAQLAESTQSVSTGLVAIYKAMGGGWEETFPLAPAAEPAPAAATEAAPVAAPSGT